jgi:hypothetical protein
MEAIKKAVAFAPGNPIFAHILDLQKQGRWDEKWIPRIAKQGWIVVTSDRGKKGGKKKGAKLPLVCKMNNVTISS